MNCIWSKRLGWSSQSERAKNGYSLVWYQYQPLDFQLVWKTKWSRTRVKPSFHLIVTISIADRFPVDRCDCSAWKSRWTLIWKWRLRIRLLLEACYFVVLALKIGKFPSRNGTLFGCFQWISSLLQPDFWWISLPQSLSSTSISCTSFNNLCYT